MLTVSSKANFEFDSLHYAVENNRKEIFEILISKGADINVKDIIYLNILVLFLIKIISKK